MSQLQSRLQIIAENCFLNEPAFFAVYCSHKITEVPDLKVAVRVGKGRVEVNSEFLDSIDDSQLAEILRIEMIRILLKHPYERQPKDCGKVACALASDCVISCNYGKSLKHFTLASPREFNLPDGEFYEFYARKIQKQLPEISGGQNSGKNEKSKSEKLAEISKLWDEDELQSVTITNLIERIQNWGSMPANLVETIKSCAKPKVDYHKILQGFRASIISSKRNLTRMKPNRRTGFNSMGSVYIFFTSLIVAVDVSKSIDSEQLAKFYDIVNGFFRYGISKIDVMQFDNEIISVEAMSKSQREVNIKGRRGTDFQKVIDYVYFNGPYDGLIILTDGYATPPVIPENFKTKILYVVTNQTAYDDNSFWMLKSGRLILINIDIF